MLRTSLRWSLQSHQRSNAVGDRLDFSARLLPQFVRAAVIGETRDGAVSYLAGSGAEYREILEAMVLRAPVDPLTGGFTAPSTVSTALIAAATPYSIVDRLRDQFHRVPLDSRIVILSDAGVSFIRGAGLAKPMSSQGLSAATPEVFTFANLRVLSRELLLSVGREADRQLREAAGQSLAAATNTSFLDPGASAIPGQRPASITNGAAVTLSSSGTSLAQVDADLKTLLGAFTDDQLARAVLITSHGVGRLLAGLRGSGGASAFPTVDLRLGGSVWGLPLLLTDAARPSGSPTESFVALVDPSQIIFADGNISLSRSENAALQFDSAPSQAAASQRSLWQNNLVGLLTERQCSWSRASAASVALLTGVQV